MYAHEPNYPSKQAVALHVITDLFEGRNEIAVEMHIRCFTTLICVELSVGVNKRAFEVDLQQGGVGVNREQAAQKMAKAMKELGVRK